METTLPEAEIESPLETINDPPFDTGRLELSIKELRGLDEALQRIHGELVNNITKLSEHDAKIKQEKDKLQKTFGVRSRQIVDVIAV